MTNNQNFFSYEGRLNRAAFIGYSLLVAVITGVLSGIFQHIMPLLVRVISLASAIVGSFLTVKRYHDIEKPGWYYWLLLIPLYNIYLAILLLFKKGTTGPNAYGPDPLAGVPGPGAASTTADGSQQTPPPAA